ncbi:MAG: Serine phosphatase RsbU, regulator of sigma subunit, partial [uncultured Rubrobacteraceae bacterium]
AGLGRSFHTGRAHRAGALRPGRDAAPARPGRVRERQRHRYHGPEEAGQPHRLRQPGLREDLGLRGRRGRGPKLPLFAGRGARPAGAGGAAGRLTGGAGVPGGLAELPQGRGALLERALRLARPRRRGKAHQLRRCPERHNRAAQDRGDPARERGAFQGDLRARRRRCCPGRHRRPLAQGQPAPVRDRRLHPRRDARDDLRRHHPPRRPGGRPRAGPGHAPGGEPDLHHGEALRKEGRLPCLGEPDGLARARRVRGAPVLYRRGRGHKRAQEDRGGAGPAARARATRPRGGRRRPAAPGPARRRGTYALGLPGLRGHAPAGDASSGPGSCRLVPDRHSRGGRQGQPTGRRPRRPGEGGPPARARGAPRLRRGRPRQHVPGAQDGAVRAAARAPGLVLLRAGGWGGRAPGGAAASRTPLPHERAAPGARPDLGRHDARLLQARPPLRRRGPPARGEPRLPVRARGGQRQALPGPERDRTHSPAQPPAPAPAPDTRCGARGRVPAGRGGKRGWGGLLRRHKHGGGRLDLRHRRRAGQGGRGRGGNGPRPLHDPRRHHEQRPPLRDPLRPQRGDAPPAPRGPLLHRRVRPPGAPGRRPRRRRRRLARRPPAAARGARRRLGRGDQLPGPRPRCLPRRRARRHPHTPHAGGDHGLLHRRRHRGPLARWQLLRRGPAPPVRRCPRRRTRRGPRRRAKERRPQVPGGLRQGRPGAARPARVV